MYTYKARIENVVDGDTMDVLVDCGFSIWVRHRIRISNYDAPESWRPKTEEERVQGNLAKAKATELLLNQDVTVRTYKEDVYARYSADVIMGDGRDFATVMKELGFVKQPQA